MLASKEGSCNNVKTFSVVMPENIETTTLKIRGICVFVDCQSLQVSIANRCV